jgi:hypothetical protein
MCSAADSILPGRLTVAIWPPLTIKEHQRVTVVAQSKKQVPGTYWGKTIKPQGGAVFYFHAGVPFFIVVFHFNTICLQPTQPIIILH